MPPPSGVRRKRSRVLLLVVLAFATFGVGEIFLRLADPFSYAEADQRKRFMRTIVGPGGDRVPDVDTTYLGEPVRTNSRGLRNPETPYAAPPGVRRLLVLGDSVPFGWGVAEGEEFPRVIQGRLNEQRACAPDRCEVINGAYPGWDPVQYGAFLEQEGLKYGPDIVLLMLINNDIKRDEGVNPRARFHIPQTQYFPGWMRKVFVLRFVDDSLAYLLHDAPPADYDPTRTPGTEHLDFALAVLGKIHELCRNAGAEMVLLDTLQVPRIIGFCEDRGLQRIEVVTTAEQAERWAISKVDLHPNAEGHAWMADRILDQLKLP